LEALGARLIAPVEANGVFVELSPALVQGLEARGWHFYRFVGEHGYRVMCSWATREETVDGFLADARKVVAAAAAADSMPRT
jgi:threonine aldolase